VESRPQAMRTGPAIASIPPPGFLPVRAPGGVAWKAPGANKAMNGRDVITTLVGLMVAGVLVWSVTAWVYTSATTRVSGTLIGLMTGGLGSGGSRGGWSLAPPRRTGHQGRDRGSARRAGPIQGDMPRPRVLLIDDSRTARATLGGGLEDAGFEVLVAGDAIEALEILSQRRCDVVLADYQLPGTNGLDLLAALRGADPDTPLLLYSASMTPELAEQTIGPTAPVRLRGVRRWPWSWRPPSPILESVPVATATPAACDSREKWAPKWGTRWI
jgi:CheY-like chemotaxis protein